MPLLTQHLLAMEALALRESFPAFLHRSFRSLNGGSAFLPGWHLAAIAEHLAAVEAGVISRLIINLPPRYLKSLTVSVAWPAWLLGQNPQRRIIVASYADKLSLKHSLDCRHLLQEDWYARAYPGTHILPGQNQKHKFVTRQQGFRLAASVGGTLTGEGGDVLIVDDPINPLNAESSAHRDRANRWFEHTFSSRLNDKNAGAIVVVMQRLHEEDLTGFLLKKGGWQVLELPAIAPQATLIGGYFRREGEALHPDRESLQRLHKMRHEMGSHAFSAQYQQQPRPPGGAMIRADWLRYDDPPEEMGQGIIVQSWDTAIKAGQKNDPSVCVTAWLGQGECFVLEVLRDRLEYSKLRSAVQRMAEKWQPQAILIEDKASGQPLLQDFRRSGNLPIIPILPKLDKLTRFAAVTPLIESGRLLLPKSAHWLAEFEREMLTFPAVTHDDQVDALSQLLLWWQHRAISGNGSGLRRI